MAPGRSAAAYLALLLLVTTVGGCSSGQGRAALPDPLPDPLDSHAAAVAAALDERCAQLTARLERFGEVTSYGVRGPRIGILGDSYTAGDGLRDRSQRWAVQLADLLPARVRTDAVGHTGFVWPGPCGGQAYATRADQVSSEPTVLLEGGLNDLREPPRRITAAVVELVDRFPDARVVVIGPVDAPATSGEPVVDRALAAGAAAAGADYLSMLPLHPTYLPEGVHLTPAGHLAYARRVAAHLRRRLPP